MDSAACIRLYMILCAYGWIFCSYISARSHFDVYDECFIMYVCVGVQIVYNINVSCDYTYVSVQMQTLAFHTGGD